MNWDETLDSYVEVVDSMTLRGYRYSNGWARNQKIYFYTTISKPFKSIQMDTVAISKEGHRIGTGYVVRLDYTTTKGEQLLLKQRFQESVWKVLRKLEKGGPDG